MATSTTQPSWPPSVPNTEPAVVTTAVPHKRWRSILAAAVVLFIGLYTYRELPSYELVGFDSYPLILTSRVQSFADFADTFREIMMDGRYPGGVFYRPTQQFIIAAEYGLWGIDPAGYHYTTLLLFATCALLIFGVIHRIGGGWIAPSLAMLLFVLHPTQLNVLPVMARRVELLAAIFVLAGLFVLPVQQGKRSWWRCLALALWVWLASGSKEVGAVVVGLAVMHQFMLSPDHSVAERLKSALKTAIVSFGAFIVFLINRTFVIRQATDGKSWLGGHPTGDGNDFANHIGPTIEHFMRVGLCPWKFDLPLLDNCPANQLATGLTILLCGMAVVMLLLGMLSPFLRGRRGSVLITLGLAWLLVHVFINGFAGKFNPRYVLIAMIAVGMILAGIINVASALFVHGGWRRAIAVAAGGCCAVIMISALHTSPLWTNFPEWRGASEIQKAYLADTRELIENSTPPKRIFEPGFPYMPLVEDSGNLFTDRPRIDNAVMLSHWTLQAWAELQFPDRRITVQKLGARARPTQRPKPDEILYLYKYNPDGPGQYRDVRPFGRLPVPVPQSRSSSSENAGIDGL